MTLEELEVKREELLARMGQPSRVKFADREVEFGPQSENENALARIDAEIGKITGANRVFNIQTKRGI